MADPFDDAIAKLTGIEEALEGEVPANTLLEIGHAAVTILTMRNKAGLDVDKKPFAPYAPSYAKARARKKLSARPDLVRTGQMIGGLFPALTGRDQVTVRFSSPFEARKAGWLNDGTRKTKERRFVGLNDDESKALAEIAGEGIAVTVRGR